MKCFGFKHGKYARSTMILEDDKTKEMMIYSKGSPHIMKDLFLSSSIPNDYEEKLESISNKGYRIVSVSLRYVDKNCKIIN